MFEGKVFKHNFSLFSVKVKMEEQEFKKNIFQKTGDFWNKCVRVLKVARKPTGEEVKQVSKVSALGILAIGMIGFIIGLLYVLLFT